MAFARFLLAACLTLLAFPSLAAEGYWQGVAKTVIEAVDRGEAAHAKGDTDSARRAVLEAYFKRFEDSKMEAAIRKGISAKRAAEIERMFDAMRKAAGGSDAAALKTAAQTLRTAVAEVGKVLDDANVSPAVFEVNQ